jgi:hypothetical protein
MTLIQIAVLLVILAFGGGSTVTGSTALGFTGPGSGPVGDPGGGPSPN